MARSKQQGRMPKQKKMKGEVKPRGEKLNQLQNIRSNRQNIESKLNFDAKEIEVLEEREKVIGVNDTTDQSKKQFYAEVSKVIFESDVIVQVLDVRDPLACRNENLEKEVIKAGKALIFLLNKIDTVPGKVWRKWVDFLGAQHTTVPFKCASGNMIKHVKGVEATSLSDRDVQSPFRVIGVEEFLKAVKSVKSDATVGIIGIPNVGKSSVVNSLVRGKKVNTGNMAGVTKTATKIKLDGSVYLYDSPGVCSRALDKDSMIFASATATDSVESQYDFVETLLRRVAIAFLLDHYKVVPFETTDEFLALIATKFGHFKGGGKPNLQAAAARVVADWNANKIRFYEPVPMNNDSAESTRIIQTYGGDEL